LYYCHYRFLKNGNNSFNTECQVISLFATKERREANSVLGRIFPSSLVRTFWSCGGTGLTDS
jgi:hypothetical protein